MESLEKLYTLDGILDDLNGDGFPDGLKGGIILGENSSAIEKKLAINLSARLGFENIALDLPLVKFNGESKDEINIKINKDINYKNKNTAEIYIAGNSINIDSCCDEALEKGGEYLYGRLPFIWEVGSKKPTLGDVVKSFESIPKVLSVSINNVMIHKDYRGLYKVNVKLKFSGNLEEVKNFIRNNENTFKWDYIREINVAFNNESKDNISIFNKELETDNDLSINSSKFTALKKIDAANFYSIDGILEDTDNDFLPDEITGKIMIRDNADNCELIAASSIAARLGLESLGISFPMVYTEKEFNNSIKNPIFIGNLNLTKEFVYNVDKASFNILRDVDNNYIILSGSGENLVKGAKYIAESLPFLNSSKGVSLEDIKKNLKASLSGDTLNGEIAYILSLIKKDKSIKDKKIDCFLKDDFENFDEYKFKNYLNSKYNVKDIGIRPFNEKQLIFEEKYDIPYEVDRFKQVLNEKLFPNLKPEDNVKIFGTLSEEKSVRDDLKLYLKDEIVKTGAKLENCDIFCAYKQGISWIMEGVIPKVHDIIKDTDEIVIKFKPFLKEGKDTWDDDDGSVPKISGAYADDENKWFDLPVRWIQELYPVDDLMAKELNFKRDKIKFEIMDKEEKSTYKIIFKDKEGNILYSSKYEAKYSERPYLNEYNGIGKVHPSTGWVKVCVNDKVVIDERIETDLELLWNIYQEKILKKCKDYILKKTDGKPLSSKQPFFKELRMDVSLSEPDFDLPVRQDRISSLDALHEDLYFVGLDFFKTFGQRTVGESLQEPGLILPVINKENGKPGYIKAGLYAEKYDRPKVVIGEKKIDINEALSDISISKIVFNDKTIEEIYVNVETYGNIEILNRLESYIELAENGVISMANGYIEAESIKFNVLSNGNMVKTLELNICSKSLENNKTLNANDVDVPVDKVIGYEDYIKIMDKMKKVKGLDVWRASKSYQGRDIYAIDIYKGFKSKIVSRNKLINSKPVFMINNRHHANEVSSTNSSLYLALKIISDEKYKKYLDRVNLTIIPFENTDGGYIHDMLQKDNPKWKLHIARFNAVGKEFAQGYWKDTKYTEANAVPNVWRKWLPDMMVDNHGVPTHEWDQQFSGYVSPWFKGFWLPRALFYGYFWYVDSPKYPNHKRLNEVLQDYVADAINRDSEIEKWNEDWKDRFEKYAHQWMPKLFPADYYKNLIFYWIAYKPNPEAWHISHRYPYITAVDFTTEVSDETAQGDYLRLCTKTHFISDIATIDMLYKAETVMEDKSFEDDLGITLKKIRKRPIKLK